VENKILATIVASLCVAIVVGSFQAVGSWGELETRQAYIAQEQVRVRATLDRIAVDMDATKSNRYTDADAREDRQRRDAQLENMNAQMTRLAELISNNLAQLAQVRERLYFLQKQRSSKQEKIR